MRKTFTVLFLTMISLATIAQTSSRISGIVQDDQGKALQSATVSLLKAKDSSLVKAAVTDKSGQYEFINIKDGNYLVSISSVGYAKNHSKSFELNGTDVTVPSLSLKM